MLKTDGLLSREKLRDLRSLDSMKIRRRKGFCLVEGERSLGEALRTRNLLYLVVSDEQAEGSRSPVGELRSPDVPCYTLANAHFQDLSDVKKLKKLNSFRTQHSKAKNKINKMVDGPKKLKKQKQMEHFQKQISLLSKLVE